MYKKIVALAIAGLMSVTPVFASEESFVTPNNSSYMEEDEDFAFPDSEEDAFIAEDEILSDADEPSKDLSDTNNVEYQYDVSELSAEELFVDGDLLDGEIASSNQLSASAAYTKITANLDVVPSSDIIVNETKIQLVAKVTAEGANGAYVPIDAKVSVDKPGLWFGDYPLTADKPYTPEDLQEYKTKIYENTESTTSFTFIGGGVSNKSGQDWIDVGSDYGYSLLPGNYTITLSYTAHGQSGDETGSVSKTISVKGYTGTQTIAATCTTPAYEVTYSNGIETSRKEISPALEHDWGEFELISYPTDTSEGIWEITCKHDSSHKDQYLVPKTVNGKFKTSIGYMEAHDTAEFKFVLKDSSGKTIETWNSVGGGNHIVYLPKGDYSVAGNLVEAIPYTNINYSGSFSVNPAVFPSPILILAQASSYTVPVEYIDATCTEPKYKIYDDGLGGTKKEAIGKPLGHNWGGWTVIKEATGKEAGEKTRECSRCHITENEPIAATKKTGDLLVKYLLPTWNIDITFSLYDKNDGLVASWIKNPKDGNNSYVVNNLYDKETYYITASGSNTEWSGNGSERTEYSISSTKERNTFVFNADSGAMSFTPDINMSQSGYGPSTYISRPVELICPNIPSGKKVVVDLYDAKNKKINSLTLGPNENVTVKGLACGSTYHLQSEDNSEINIAAENNTFKVEDGTGSMKVNIVATWTTITDAKCNEPSYRIYYTNGSETKKEEVTPKLGHSFGEWKIIKSATVNAEGEEERICSRCGEKEIRKIAKLEQAVPEKTVQSPTSETQQTVSTSENTATTLKVKAKGLKKKKLSIKKGKSVKLKVTSNKKVTYKSKNKKIASVSKTGKIKAKKKGKTTITVKAGNKTFKIKVTVK